MHVQQSMITMNQANGTFWHSGNDWNAMTHTAADTGGGQGDRCPCHHDAKSLQPACEAAAAGVEHPCYNPARGGTGKVQVNMGSRVGQKAEGDVHLGEPDVG